MTRDQSSTETPPAAVERKPWVEPQLDVFAMSEAESGDPHNFLNDGVTNRS